MRAILSLVGILLIMVIQLSCTPKNVPLKETVSSETQSQTLAGKSKETWEVKWQETLNAARKEGSVLLYTSTGGDWRSAIVEAFTNKFGIKLEVVVGRGSEVARKVLAERSNNIFLSDIYIGGGTTIFTILKPAKVFAPLEPEFILPEVTNPKGWWDVKSLWLDEERTVWEHDAYPGGKLNINTNLVKPGEIKTLSDLLNPKWKGKILLNDPTAGGSGSKGMAVAADKLGWDFWQELASKQQLMITRDERLQLDWLAHGKYAILLFGKSEVVGEWINAGAPVALINVSGLAYITGDSIALFNKAPHPNAARLFINWFLTREGQTISQRFGGSQSGRVDITADIPGLLREPGVDYISSNQEKYIIGLEDSRKKIAEIIGPYIAR